MSNIKGQYYISDALSSQSMDKLQPNNPVCRTNLWYVEWINKNNIDV